ncbi:epoxide hydrolase 1-like [Argiope bruennichi]|uniref:epoxide hydrolase 1-like n=1 Tax=Argiope bruennichi TaxID=94029 RepID=UPI00249455AB|nr:epoxide hydrolase 1-like [Argiope bruennichi]XP_055949755.1 epoxide hydrolase 1-like [Argiope bruennichi]XP_055949756.1 epoxide hydrolase 1-like [Argiope bruennichi]XP_055949757.1 epoxide hydrolase 1-like [Argiope bruennichi]
MVAFLVFLSIIGILFVKFLYSLIFKGYNDQRASKGYKASWYGKDPPPTLNDGSQDDVSIHPFKIDIPSEVIEDLKNRLQRTRFEEPVEDSKFHYGFNPKYLKTVLEYWRSQYDWRKQEAELNRFPQFKTRIEGINVHFLHIKPPLLQESTIKVIPLMIIHGWPGSIVEFYKIIPLLTTPRPDCNFVFEVICPSIPGYGFSESPHRKGFNARAAARIFITLMERLGHNSFYVQGGDWGSYISSLMARYYPPRIRGLHVNMYFFMPRPWELFKGALIALFPFLVRKEEYLTTFPLKKKIGMLLEEGGYFHIQATKPDTLGCGMADSPAGVAAYLLEKFGISTDSQALNLDNGALTKKFTLDELLTNVMMYWVNNNFTAAARFYKENVRNVFSGRNEKAPVTVPSGVAVFPNEVLMVPKTMMSQQMKNIVSYSIMPRGGHFAALEEPQLLADDIFKFVAIVERKDNSSQ